jgi:hypothetical protein
LYGDRLMAGFRTNEIIPRPNQLQFKSPNPTVNLSCAAPFASFFCQPGGSDTHHRFPGINPAQSNRATLLSRFPD